MNQEIIYHGSNVTVSVPQITINGHYKDFGYGFYCTNIEKQAKRWALAKHGASIVNRYLYTADDTLNTLSFPEMTEEWLQRVKFKYPTHQIVFCTKKALNTIQFEGSMTI